MIWPEATAPEVGGDREFRYRVSAWYLITSAVLTLFALALLVDVVLVVWTGGWAALSEVPWGLTLSAVLAGLLGLWGACDIGWEILLSRRGLVSVTRVGVVVRDSRGHDDRMFWDELEELRAGPLLSLGRRTTTPYAAFELRGRGKALRVGQRIEDREELHHLIVQRAGLVPAEKTWYGVVVYRCPQPS